MEAEQFRTSTLRQRKGRAPPTVRCVGSQPWGGGSAVCGEAQLCVGVSYVGVNPVGCGRSAVWGGGVSHDDKDDVDVTP